MRDLTLRLMLSAVIVVAAATQIAGIGHWRMAFAAIGGEPMGRYATAAVELLGLVMLWWPGRRAYGAAILFATCLGAAIAHLTALGISSAPPAVLLAVIAGMLLRRDQADLAW